MRAFAYERPESIADAVGLLAEHGPDARLLAGGTDLIIRLRDGTIRPRVVVDVKRIAELDGGIRETEAGLTIGARATMTAIGADERIRRDFTALAEAAAVVGAVQIRNRATLAGNICNASPAADTVPALLTFDAVVVAAGPGGTRRSRHSSPSSSPMQAPRRARCAPHRTTAWRCSTSSECERSGPRSSGWPGPDDRPGKAN